MALKAVIDKAEDVPEALRDEYIEKDGKFFLDIEGLGAHTSVVALTNSLTNAKKERQTLQTRVVDLEKRVAGLPDDFDPARYADVLAELEALKKDPNRDEDTEKKLQKERERYEQRLRDSEKAKTDALRAKDDEIGERDGVIGELLIDDGLTASLVKNGIAKEFMPAVKAMLKSSFKVERDDESKKRIAVAETDLGKVGIDKFVENWAKSDDGKPFVVPAKGGNGQGSGGGNGRTEANPWATGTINLTEQGRLVRDDPPKAERLMKAAGVPAAKMQAVLRAA